MERDKKPPSHLCRGVQFRLSLMVQKYFYSDTTGVVFSAGGAFHARVEQSEGPITLSPWTPWLGQQRAWFVVPSACTHSIGQQDATAAATDVSRASPLIWWTGREVRGRSSHRHACPPTSEKPKAIYWQFTLNAWDVCEVVRFVVALAEENKERWVGLMGTSTKTLHLTLNRHGNPLPPPATHHRWRG